MVDLVCPGLTSQSSLSPTLVSKGRHWGLLNAPYLDAP